MAKANTCQHIINGVDGDRACTKDATHTIDAGNGREFRCTKHFHTSISRAMKRAKQGSEVNFKFTQLETA